MRNARGSPRPALPSDHSSELTSDISPRPSHFTTVNDTLDEERTSASSLESLPASEIYLGMDPQRPEGGGAPCALLHLLQQCIHSDALRSLNQPKITSRNARRKLTPTAVLSTAFFPTSAIRHLFTFACGSPRSLTISATNGTPVRTQTARESRGTYYVGPADYP